MFAQNKYWYQYSDCLRKTKEKKNLMNKSYNVWSKKKPFNIP